MKIIKTRSPLCSQHQFLPTQWLLSWNHCSLPASACPLLCGVTSVNRETGWIVSHLRNPSLAHTFLFLYCLILSSSLLLNLLLILSIFLLLTHCLHLPQTSWNSDHVNIFSCLTVTTHLARSGKCFLHLHISQIIHFSSNSIFTVNFTGFFKTCCLLHTFWELTLFWIISWYIEFFSQPLLTLFPPT